MEQALTLRLITPDDSDFLYRVYASAREAELALTGWDDAQKMAFLRMQFNAQHAYYQEHYTTAQFLIIELEGEPIGRLYVVQWPDEIRIIDIALLPEYRDRGYGTRLLDNILAEGARAGLPVTIHIEQFNPALKLYERLGFRPITAHGVYYLMEKKPSAVQDER